MIYDFKREKDLRELQKTNDYPERPHQDAILDVRAKAKQLMREFVGEPDVPAEPGCWLVVGPLCEEPCRSSPSQSSHGLSKMAASS